MRREVRLTNDGSATILIPHLGVTYHSTHGAIQESRQVYIVTGLEHYHRLHPGKDIHIFEMGLGTGLNAILAAQFAEQHGIHIYYDAVELYPVTTVEAEALNYGKQLQASALQEQIHNSNWGEAIAVTPNFTLTKHHSALKDFRTEDAYDIIFFDAFDPLSQPELWTAEVFRKLYDMTVAGGILTTYSSKSVVRKALQEAGYHVTKHPGPHGKREIVRGEKQ